MSQILAREKALLSEVLAQPPAAREAFLVRACGSDGSLRKRLCALVAAHAGADSLLDPPGQGARALLGGTPGDRIGRYTLIEKIGEGGCGVVWKAWQREPVRREVAVKVIKLGMDTTAVLARFEAERQALARMDHPGIATVLDGGASESGRPYFVMELVRGKPITAFCDEHHLAPRARVELAIKLCQAVQHAHEKGVVHRDLKPANILVAVHDGVPVPKVIDFGIAKAIQGRLSDATLFTAFDQFMGTPAYMSPEQVETSGAEIDLRSDIYSLGVLLYELLTGRPPVDPGSLGSAGIEEIRQQLRTQDPPKPSTRWRTLGEPERTRLAHLRGTSAASLTQVLRGDLDWIVMKCLEKDRTRRYATAGGLGDDLGRHLRHEPVTARPPSLGYVSAKLVRRHRAGLATAAVLGVAVGIGGMQAYRAMRAEQRGDEFRQQAEQTQRDAIAAREHAERVRWARDVALPEIQRRIRKDELAAAFTLAREAAKFIPDDPTLAEVLPIISAEVTISTFHATPGGEREDVAGVDVYFKPYRQPTSDWEHIGRTPLEGVRMGRDLYRWQLRREGDVLLEAARGWYPLRRDFKAFDFAIPRASNRPSGMVRVGRGFRAADDTLLPHRTMQGYSIDRHEVTNREFQAFVAAGGYANRTFWKHPFLHEGRTLSWEQAMERLVDETGQLGPATWKNGTFAAGEADFPVTGVSWYEAAAFAEFAGKRLPSIYHWAVAATLSHAPFSVPLSNFSGEKLAAVGTYPGMGQFGTYDMAGNAREWCWNEADDGLRYVLGGGWRDPQYMFEIRQAKPPFDRSDTNGFRCIKVGPADEADPELDAPMPRPIARDYRQEKPVPDDEFKRILTWFAYDKTNLDPRVEAVDDGRPGWRMERVSFNTAYNEERMSALLFLPKNVAPPFQAIALFTGTWARFWKTPEQLHRWDVRLVLPLVESGRAVILPAYKGTYGHGPQPRGPMDPAISRVGSVAERDQGVHWAKDLGRAIDYLETRPDIRADQLGYLGYSWGGYVGPILTAVESRLKVGMWLLGGYYNGAIPAKIVPGPEDGKPLPEVDQLNFVPRVRIPVLMLNGRYDPNCPVETSQQPMFRALGTAPGHKRHVIFETGHDLPQNQVDEEVRGWLDRHLGPVR